jgi:mannose-6-phosphate isomerase-like protein (cupin superfamily)
MNIMWKGWAKTMTKNIPIVFSENKIRQFDRGNGVITRLFCNEAICGAKVTTGTTNIPVGKSVALHSHNCDEQIIILSGRAEAEFRGIRTPIGPMEVAYIPSGEVHCFHNVGTEPVMMLFIYDAGEVTRTFAATGETVVHLDGGDLAQPKTE